MPERILHWYNTLMKDNLFQKQADDKAKKAGSKIAAIPQVPKKRVLIVYSIFTILLVLAAAAAWFYKQPSFLRLEESVKKEVAQQQRDFQNNVLPQTQTRKKVDESPVQNHSLQSTLDIDKIAEQVQGLEQQLEQLQTEVALNKAQLYIDSASQLIETRSSPALAFELLHLARSYLAEQATIPMAAARALQAEADEMLSLLQNYRSRSPRNLLPVLSELIESVQQQNSIPEPIAEERARQNSWIDQLFGSEGILLRVERARDEGVGRQQLLLNLLILARIAVLTSDQEQFRVALEDALKLIEVMPQAPISQAQITHLLSQDIAWQLPQVGHAQ